MTNDVPNLVAHALLSREGTGPHWGIAIDEARVGYARISLRVRADMLNGFGTAHGGVIFALADTAFAYACNSRNEKAVAASASITYLAAAHPGDILIAEAIEKALAGRTGFYVVAVRTSAGRAIAEFSGASRTIGGRVVDIEDDADFEIRDVDRSASIVAFRTNPKDKA